MHFAFNNLTEIEQMHEHNQWNTFHVSCCSVTDSTAKYFHIYVVWWCISICSAVGSLRLYNDVLCARQEVFRCYS